MLENYVPEMSCRSTQANILSNLYQIKIYWVKIFLGKNRNVDTEDSHFEGEEDEFDKESLGTRIIHKSKDEKKFHMKQTIHKHN